MIDPHALTICVASASCETGSWVCRSLFSLNHSFWCVRIAVLKGWLIPTSNTCACEVQDCGYNYNYYYYTLLIYHIKKITYKYAFAFHLWKQISAHHNSIQVSTPCSPHAQFTRKHRLAQSNDLRQNLVFDLRALWLATESQFSLQMEALEALLMWHSNCRFQVHVWRNHSAPRK